MHLLQLDDRLSSIYQTCPGDGHGHGGYRGHADAALWCPLFLKWAVAACVNALEYRGNSLNDAHVDDDANFTDDRANFCHVYVGGRAYGGDRCYPFYARGYSLSYFGVCVDDF